MEYKKSLKNRITMVATILLLAFAAFSGCSPSASQISPMPAYDESKNTASLEEISEVPAVASSPAFSSPIEYTEPTQIIINQGSNTENNGLSIKVDGTIYYLNNGLNSMSPSGYHQKLLIDWPDIIYLTASGDYIYFVSSEEYDIYRCKIGDWNNPEKLGISGAYSIIIINDHIYYQNAIGESSNDYIYRADLDGTNPENLMIKASAYTSDGRYMYFSNSEDDSKLYSLDTCTGTIEQLSNNQASQINVIDGHIYYINKTTKHITKLNIETLESEILIEGEFSYLNSSDSLLVYFSQVTGLLGAISKDGEPIGDILEYNDINALNITDDWIFFESFENTHEEKVFWLKTDGSSLSGELPVSSMSIITGYDQDTKTLYCDFVRYLTGDEALKEYINDFSVSERNAQEVLEQNNGVYIQNVNKKILSFVFSDLTDITLNINADSSYSFEGYKATLARFEEIYAKDPSLITDQIYHITADEETLVRITQFYQTSN